LGFTASLDARSLASTNSASAVAKSGAGMQPVKANTFAPVGPKIAIKGSSASFTCGQKKSTPKAEGGDLQVLKWRFVSALKNKHFILYRKL
jgi:hypothetical protein